MARTHCSINAFLLALIAALSIGLVTACENTARGLKQDAAALEAETRDDRAQARERAKDVAGDAAQTARVVGSMAAEAGEQVAERAGALSHHASLKAALMADPAIDSTRLDVDVNAETRTITLGGYVPSAAERTRAEQISRDKAGGYTVVNKIAVRPR